MPFQFSPPVPPETRVALEPVYNALHSMALLNEVERLPALSAWVTRSADLLTPPQQRANQLVFGPLVASVVYEGSWPTMGQYLAELAASSPAVLAERVQAVAEAGHVPLDPAARALVEDPPALHDMVVSHLAGLWSQFIAPEWQRQQDELGRDTAFLQAQLNEGALAKTLHALIGSAAASGMVSPPGVARVVYVPSPHTGRYVTRLQTHTTLRVFFEARRSLTALMRTSRVALPELTVRLAALADETRLQILQLFAEHDELSAQEIMARLELSQSNVSRQLKQLTSINVLAERRKGATKRYSLVPAQLAATRYALEQLVAGDHAPPADTSTSHPDDLRRFLNHQGLLRIFPARPRDQRLALEYLARQFERGRDYTEKAVNEVIKRHIAHEDYVTLRRELINHRLLMREGDGSRYWVPE